MLRPVLLSGDDDDAFPRSPVTCQAKKAGLHRAGKVRTVRGIEAKLNGSLNLLYVLPARTARSKKILVEFRLVDTDRLRNADHGLGSNMFTFCPTGLEARKKASFSSCSAMAMAGVTRIMRFHRTSGACLSCH